MTTETVERARTGGPGSGLGGNWLVIVLNDDHNTFDHMARTLSNVIPRVSLDEGYWFADRINGPLIGLLLIGLFEDALPHSVATFEDAGYFVVLEPTFLLFAAIRGMTLS